MYSKQQILEAIGEICDHFGLIYYEHFDIDSTVLKINIENRDGDLIHTSKIDLISFDSHILEDIWDTLSNNTSNEPIENCITQKCEYCDDGKALVIGKTNDYGIAIQYPNSLIAYGYDIHGSSSNGLVTKINYCPMCGKKLTK